MKVFWMLNFLPPPLAAALNLPVQASGSWVSGLQTALQGQPVQLVLCGYSPLVSSLTRQVLQDTVYIALPQSGKKAALQQALLAEQPDLVQLFGTENEHAAWVFECFDASRILLYVQGLAGPCGQQMADGLPPRFLKRKPLKEFLATKTGGATVWQLRQGLLEKGEKELQVLQKARHILGRTQWDKAYCAGANPQAAYYTLNEIMRPDFYKGGWHADTCQPHRLFLSQGNIPLKGLHRLLAELPRLIEAFPDTQLYIAGWPPPSKGALLAPFINWLAEYQGYLAQLIKRLNLQPHIHYTGVLNAQDVKQQLLQCQTYILCSSIENSPNSLGEAMLLGVPCAASAVGGVPSMISSPEQGLLFDPAQPGALAAAVLELWNDPASAQAMGQNARTRALHTHDSAVAAQTMMQIWQQVLGSDSL